MASTEDEGVVSACGTCGGSGMQTVGCNLFPCQECNGRGVSEPESTENKETEEPSDC